VIVVFFIAVACALFSSGFFVGTVWASMSAADREADDYEHARDTRGQAFDLDTPEGRSDFERGYCRR
jgi:hypothetical protein